MLPDELRILRDTQRAANPNRIFINVCGAAGCQSLESEKVKGALAKAALEAGYTKEQCLVRQVGCMGLCGAGPLVRIDPAGLLYQKVQVDDAAEIVGQLEGPAVERLQLDSSMPFFARQHRIVLENSGRIDPE